MQSSPYPAMLGAKISEGHYMKIDGFRIFRRYQVPAKSVADFVDQYYAHDVRGEINPEEIERHETKFATEGFIALNELYSKTGGIVAYYGPAEPMTDAERQRRLDVIWEGFPAHRKNIVKKRRVILQHPGYGHGSIYLDLLTYGEVIYYYNFVMEGKTL